MSRFARWAVMTAVLALPLLGLAALASADVAVSQVDWQTLGSDVRFHARFYNTDPGNSSGAVSGEMNSQHFGAFLPNAGPIGTFNIPPLAPDSFFDVFFDVPLSQLPLSAETILPGGGPAGAPGITGLAQPACTMPREWNGNVDISWLGPGGVGNVNYHFGQLLICPGAGNSYIHVVMDCEDPAGLSWSISGLCPGWSANLLVTVPVFQPGGPAPNPIPPGLFDGWICISADLSVTTGGTCNPVLNFMCGSQPAAINMSAEACEWGAVPVEPTTWGEMKTRFGKTVE